MNKLPPNFEIEKYGLHVSLVTENDADFILQLRVDPKLSKYLHSTDNHIEKQKEWIRKYKYKESKGEEYYFIYRKNGIPVGVNRIYNIHEHLGTIGSWICPTSNETETSLATYFLMLDIFFNKIELDLSVFDVRKKNTHVWKLHKMVGAIVVGESDIDYYFTLNKSTYISKRNNLLSILNIK